MVGACPVRAWGKPPEGAVFTEFSCIGARQGGAEERILRLYSWVEGDKLRGSGKGVLRQ